MSLTGRYTVEAIRKMRPSKNVVTGRWRAPPLSRRRQKLALHRLTVGVGRDPDASRGGVQSSSTPPPGMSSQSEREAAFGAAGVPRFLYQRDDPGARPPKGRLFERRAEARFARIEANLASVNAEVEKHRRALLLEKWKLKKLDKGAGLLLPVKRPSAPDASAAAAAPDESPLPPLDHDVTDPHFLVQRIRETKTLRKSRKHRTDQ